MNLIEGWQMVCVSASARLRLCAAASLLAAIPVAAWCGTFADVYNFTAVTDGASPASPLVADGSGNLYSETTQGGVACADNPTSGCGVIYRLDPHGGVTTLYSFVGGAEGSLPHTGMLLERNTLYGTAGGGSNNAGVFFSLGADGSNYMVLHQFTGKDGYFSVGSPVSAPHGGIVGVTDPGGPGYVAGKANGYGVLYQILQNGDYRVLHNFTNSATDGRNPNYLVRDSSGNIFGSTYHGGRCSKNLGCGTIFELNAATGVYTIIYSFTGGSDGTMPVLGGVDATGTIFGAASGGTSNHGTLFSLSPTPGGAYAFNLLASLKSTAEGDNPVNPPVLAANGALVGATSTYMYAYRHGFVYNLATFGAAVPITGTQAPFTIVGGAIEGPSLEGGIIPCAYNGQVFDSRGCGFVFSYVAGK